MTTDVSTTIYVVNGVGDNNRRREHAEGVSTLYERIEWCRVSLAGPDGKPLRERELARRAREALIASGHHREKALAEQTINMALTRLRKNPKNGSMKADTLLAIALAAKVNPVWLLTGHGPREIPDPPMAEILEALGREKALVATCLADPDRWRLSTIARALTMTVHRDALPTGGWAPFLDQIQSGVLDEEELGDAMKFVRKIEATLEPIPKLRARSR